MKNIVKEEVKKYTETIESVTCDICKSNIPVNTLYFEVSTHHNHWGMDSIDSFEYFDLCSAKCLTEHMNEYVKVADLREYFYDIETEKWNSKTQ